MKNKKEFLESLRPLINLWPAGVVLAVTMASLPGTAPVLKDIPERLEEAAEELGKTDDVMAAEPEEEEEQAVGDYDDGIYTGSARGYGGDVRVQVTVEDHQITAVDILSASGETPSFFKRAQGVIASVLKSQTWEVDTISGATYSSKGILGAVQNAITGETVTNEKPASSGSAAKSTASIAFADPSSYNDGIYTGSAQGFGGTISVAVTISGGKITAVDVTNHSGETASYYNRAKAVTSRIISAQSPNVDIVSGATCSSRGIINAAKLALSKAAVNGASEDTEDQEDTENTEITVPEDVFLEGSYINGEYEGTAEGFGGDITSKITIQNNQITAVEIVSAEDETPPYLEKAKGLIPEIIQKQTSDVDTVSGATYSSQGIIGSVKDALSKAEAEEEPTDPAEPGESGTGEETTDPAEPTGGEDSPYVPVVYNNGTYTGTAEVIPDEYEDFDAYEIRVQVTFFNDQITEIAFTEDNTFDGVRTNRTLSNRAMSTLSEEVVLEQTAEDLDVVSGATCSSKAIKEAIQNAINQARIDSSCREDTDPAAEPAAEPGTDTESDETAENTEEADPDTAGENADSSSSDENAEKLPEESSEAESEETAETAEADNSESTASSDSDSKKTSVISDAKPEDTENVLEAE